MCSMYRRSMSRRSRDRLAREKANDAPARRPGIRHVEVAINYTEGSPFAWPGVIVDWKRDDETWLAQVAYVPRDGYVTVAWLPPAQLRPIGS